MADEVGLDLVEIAPDANPPVCKIMDFGKYKYEMAQKAREQRQNQTHIVVKEIRLRPKIENHDYETKRNQIEKFLTGGDKVKVTIQFRGREQSRPELGFKLLQRVRLVDPGGLELGDVLLVDLLERGETVAGEVARIGEPVLRLFRSVEKTQGRDFRSLYRRSKKNVRKKYGARCKSGLLHCLTSHASRASMGRSLEKLPYILARNQSLKTPCQ